VEAVTWLSVEPLTVLSTRIGVMTLCVTDMEDSYCMSYNYCTIHLR
jgi:hypothetical protein